MNISFSRIPSGTTPEEGFKQGHVYFVYDPSSDLGRLKVCIDSSGTLEDYSGEDISNKVTSWSETVTDTNYPSEKLTYDSLSGKVDTTTTVNGYPLSSDVSISKADLGLDAVDNTSDLNKPVSRATQTAIANKQSVLVSGSNIKTINNSILGEGNLTIACTDAEVVQTSGDNDDKVMSQAATTDLIGSSVADIETMPPIAGFVRETQSTLYSYYRYAFEDIYNVSMMVKTGGIGNHYAHGKIIELKKDDSNYFSVYIAGYFIHADNKKAGTIINSYTSENINNNIVFHKIT